VLPRAYPRALERDILRGFVRVGDRLISGALDSDADPGAFEATGRSAVGSAADQLDVNSRPRQVAVDSLSKAVWCDVPG
jgi:hypothetical protein